MKVLVFGAGAVGSVLGALLSRAHEVTLIGRQAHVDAIRRHGLTVEGTQNFTVRIRAEESVEGVASPDLVLLCVKSYDTGSALEQIASLISQRTALICVQNGLGNFEAAAARFPRNLVLGASVMYGCLLVAPGRVRWTGAGRILVGARLVERGPVDAIIAELRRGDVEAERTDNVDGALWLKAIVNAAINPLTALHRVENGALLSDPTLRETMRRVVDEATRVAAAAGVRIPVADTVAHVEGVARQTAQNRSSMLQSVERGQRTEIDAINGRIVETGRRLGVACPVNEDLVRRVRDLEPKR